MGPRSPRGFHLRGAETRSLHRIGVVARQVLGLVATLLASNPDHLGRGVTVARLTLDQLVQVRILAAQLIDPAVSAAVMVAGADDVSRGLRAFRQATLTPRFGPWREDG